MTLQRQVSLLVARSCAFIVLLWLLRKSCCLSLPALCLAYFLDPVADGLERMGLPRIVATL